MKEGENVVKEIVQFFLSGKKYAVELKNMQGIENYSKLTEISDAVETLLGVVTIRGEIIPVINVNVCLSLKQTSITDATKYVVLRSVYGKMALIADDVGDISRLTEEDSQECPFLIQGTDTGYVSFVAKDGHNLVLVIDPDKLISEDDWKSIKSRIEEIENME